MADEIRYSLEKFEKAFNALKDGADKASSELENDGVIQRFEFCFELMWKAGKIVLSDRGITASSPKEVLKEMFRQGWISDEAKAVEMMYDRNLMSHTYDKNTADKALNRIKNSHIAGLERILSAMKKAVLQ